MLIIQLCLIGSPNSNNNNYPKIALNGNYNYNYSSQINDHNSNIFSIIISLKEVQMSTGRVAAKTNNKAQHCKFGK